MLGPLYPRRGLRNRPLSMAEDAGRVRLRGNAATWTERLAPSTVIDQIALPSDRDIYACAKLLIDRFGEDGALDHCDERVAALVDEKDGVIVWKGIKVAVTHLLAGAPGPDDVVN